jgi:hypothetical protein
MAEVEQFVKDVFSGFALLGLLGLFAFGYLWYKKSQSDDQKPGDRMESDGGGNGGGNGNGNGNGG